VASSTAVWQSDRGWVRNDPVVVKGKSHFSQIEAASITSILRQVRRSDREGQKRLRDTLREKHRFYISNFTSSKRGFTAEDFAALIESGRVTLSR
jgi:hypothetical protein